MITPPIIIESQELLTAVISLNIPRAEIQHVMGPAVQEILGALAAQRLRPVGPWFSHHRQITPDRFDFDACFPVSAPVAPAGRVKPGRLPARTVARTVYQGPYEGLGQAWGEFSKWVAASGHAPAPDLWEVYQVGPHANPDPSAWLTELNRPLLQP